MKLMTESGVCKQIIESRGGYLEKYKTYSDVVKVKRRFLINQYRRKASGSEEELV